jgi:IS30 family transposase
VLTLVDRKTGYVLIGRPKQRTIEEVNRRAIALLRSAGCRVRTLTLDNGTGLHGYKAVDAATGAEVFECCVAGSLARCRGPSASRSLRAPGILARSNTTSERPA